MTGRIDDDPDYRAALDRFLAPLPMVVVDEDGMRIETVDIHADTRRGVAERRAERDARDPDGEKP